MEIARMNYYFTGSLIILFVLLCFMKPAHSRNDYLNNGTNTCSTGDVSVSIEQRDSEYRHRHFNSNNNYTNPSDDRSIRLTYRHYLGSACTDRFKDVQQENMELKQQLELMKMCGKVNKNPTLKHNPNFYLLVAKCSGIVINDENQERPDGSAWDDLRYEYQNLPEHKNKKFMGTKNIMLPPEDFKLPEPTND
tara:strand:+ start:87 stop:665 length:579 start_codon:yes stop_codon:yes gene_type:complete